MHITTRHIGIWLATVFLSVSALAQAALPTTEGEVRRVDTRAQTITLKHGEIKNLDMPPMTMVFQAQPAALQGLQAMDKHPGFGAIGERQAVLRAGHGNSKRRKVGEFTHGAAE